MLCDSNFYNSRHRLQVLKVNIYMKYTFHLSVHTLCPMKDRTQGKACTMNKYLMLKDMGTQNLQIV